ncbi:MAG: hypothetical protein HZA89_01535 [Verrucomicrobia bacterium]|nr:hypothetical protein [Verrucomicrobiota bacterium]
MKIIARLAPLFLALALAAAAPATFKVSEFTFARPAAWEWVEVSSSMRAAQLNVPAADGREPGEVVFFHFGAGGGGGTKANVDRWLSQFQEPREQLKPKIEEKTVGKTKLTYVHAEGTYSSGMPGGPKVAKPDHGLYGAIVEGAEGSVFVRMTGPKALVKSALGDFNKMIEGALK